jgi:hypothetical protein
VVRPVAEGRHGRFALAGLVAISLVAGTLNSAAAFVDGCSLVSTAIVPGQTALPDQVAGLKWSRRRKGAVPQTDGVERDRAMPAPRIIKGPPVSHYTENVFFGSFKRMCCGRQR